MIKEFILVFALLAAICSISYIASDLIFCDNEYAYR